MKHLTLFESFMNEDSSYLSDLLSMLDNSEKAKLKDLVENADKILKKIGFNTYIDIKGMGYGYDVNIVVELDKSFDSYREGDYTRTKIDEISKQLKYKKDFGVKINDKVTFDYTSGRYDGPWDDSTMPTASFLNKIK